jgi:hypothetical protein
MRLSDIVAGRESTHPYPTHFGRIILTTELLERVLLQLPQIDLLHSQRVCRPMRNLVKTSPAIETKLCLRAAKHGKTGSWIIDSESNALLVGTHAQDYIANAVTAGVNIKTIQPVIINPLIILKMEDNPSTLRYLPEGSGSGCFAVVPNKYIAKLENSSCLNMYLTQPPVTAVQLNVYGRIYYGETEI